VIQLRIKKIIQSLLFIGSFFFLLAVSISAGGQATIDASVTPLLVSVATSVSSMSYGALALNTIDNPPFQDAAIMITQDGNVNEDISIRGDVASRVSGGGSWSLAETVGANQYVHKYGFGVVQQDITSSSFSAMTMSNHEFVSNVAPNPNVGVGFLKFRMSMPTSTSNYGEYRTSIYLVATQHT